MLLLAVMTSFGELVWPAVDWTRRSSEASKVFGLVTERSAALTAASSVTPMMIHLPLASIEAKAWSSLPAGDPCPGPVAAPAAFASMRRSIGSGADLSASREPEPSQEPGSPRRDERGRRSACEHGRRVLAQQDVGRA